MDILCPNRDVDAAENNNNQCMVIKIEHRGWSFIFTGDSPSEDWFHTETGILKIHAAKVGAQVLHASHHGSRTFFTPSGQRPLGQPEYKKEDYDRRSIQQIAPVHSFITCSDDEEADFPNPVALEIYKEETNRRTPGTGHSHVILSRDSKHLHYVVDDDGRLYCRTSYSRTNYAPPADGSSVCSVKGWVSGGRGYLTREGIWVAREPLNATPTIKFQVQAKGPWPSDIEFDWWVVNNGQGNDQFHRKYYTIDSQDRKKRSQWERPLAFEGAHLMQCHASSTDGSIWANWCVLVCHESSISYAHRWLQLFPDCIDARFINN